MTSAVRFVGNDARERLEAGFEGSLFCRAGLNVLLQAFADRRLFVPASPGRLVEFRDTA